MRSLVCAALSRRSLITNLNVVLAYRNIILEIVVIIISALLDYFSLFSKHTQLDDVHSVPGYGQKKPLAQAFPK